MRKDGTAVARPGRLRPSAVGTLMRLLLERGWSAGEIERGLDYAEAQGARTIRDGFVLALSRIQLTDAQLLAGMLVSLDEAATPAPMCPAAQSEAGP